MHSFYQQHQQPPQSASSSRSVQSNEDHPIDLTQIENDRHEDGDDHNTTLVVQDDEEEECIPDSLREFVAQAHSTLEATQLDFWGELAVSGTATSSHSLGPAATSTSSQNRNDADGSHGAAPPPREDDEDRALKGEILDRFLDQQPQQHHGISAEDDRWPPSPDVWNSPPPNPVAALTDSQVRRQVRQILHNEQQQPQSEHHHPSSDVGVDDLGHRGAAVQDEYSDPFAALGSGSSNNQHPNLSAFSSPPPPPDYMEIMAAQYTQSSSSAGAGESRGTQDYLQLLAQQTITSGAPDSTKSSGGDRDYMELLLAQPTTTATSGDGPGSRDDRPIVVVDYDDNSDNHVYHHPPARATASPAAAVVVAAAPSLSSSGSSSRRRRQRERVVDPTPISEEADGPVEVVQPRTPASGGGGGGAGSNSNNNNYSEHRTFGEEDEEEEGSNANGRGRQGMSMDFSLTDSHAGRGAGIHTTSSSTMDASSFSARQARLLAATASSGSTGGASPQPPPPPKQPPQHVRAASPVYGLAPQPEQERSFTPPVPTVRPTTATRNGNGNGNSPPRASPSPLTIAFTNSGGSSSHVSGGAKRAPTPPPPAKIPAAPQRPPTPPAQQSISNGSSHRKLPPTPPPPPKAQQQQRPPTPPTTGNKSGSGSSSGSRFSLSFSGVSNMFRGGASKGNTTRKEQDEKAKPAAAEAVQPEQEESILLVAGGSKETIEISTDGGSSADILVDHALAMATTTTNDADTKEEHEQQQQASRLALSNGAENQQQQYNESKSRNSIDNNSTMSSKVVDPSSSNNKSTIDSFTEKKSTSKTAGMASSSSATAGSSSSNKKKKPLSVSTRASPNSHSGAATASSASQATPSPLSMSSPKFEKAATTRSSRKTGSPTTDVSSPTVETLPPPRFSPPDSAYEQKREKARFSAETAERLSRPTVKTTTASSRVHEAASERLARQRRNGSRDASPAKTNRAVPTTTTTATTTPVGAAVASRKPGSSSTLPKQQQAAPSPVPAEAPSSQSPSRKELLARRIRKAQQSSPSTLNRLQSPTEAWKASHGNGSPRRPQQEERQPAALPKTEQKRVLDRLSRPTEAWKVSHSERRHVVGSRSTSRSPARVAEKRYATSVPSQRSQRSATSTPERMQASKPKVKEQGNFLDRLSRPTEAWRAAHQKTATAPSPRRSTEAERTTHADSPKKLIAAKEVSVLDRLSRPTEAWQAAHTATEERSMEAATPTENTHVKHSKEPITTEAGTSSALDRLSRPTEAWQAAHHKTASPAPRRSVESPPVFERTIASERNPIVHGGFSLRAPPMDVSKSASASPSPVKAKQSKNAPPFVVASSPIRSPPRVPPKMENGHLGAASIPQHQHHPAPHFTPEMAERLSRPTESRSFAIRAASPQRRDNMGTSDEGGEHHQHHHHHHIPAPLPATSHLLTPTAVSKARKTTVRKPVVRPSPPKKVVTSVSEHLLKPTVARKAALTDAQLKARERIREYKHQRAETGPLSPEEKIKLNVKEGIAKAKERLRRAQELKQQRASRNSGAMGPPLPRVSNKRPLTVPRSPKFSSGPTRHGDRPPTGQHQSLAQCTINFGKGLRDDSSNGSTSSKQSKSSQRCLTVPKEPKLSTGKYGPKNKRFASDKPALALSQDVLQKELRGGYQPSSKRRNGPTIPVTPKFQAVHQRSAPKSTAQQEEELMAYNNAHPFKAARPPSRGRSSVGSRQSLGFQQPTQGSIAREHSTGTKEGPPSSRSNSSLDPNARFSDHFRSAASAGAESRRTSRHSMTSNASQGRAQAKPHHYQEDDGPRPFRANPVPKTTYQYKPIVPKPSAVVDPFSPELQSKERAVQRADFDEYARREREEADARAGAIEEQRRVEEEADLQERRRLPVSEGGMIPTAEPVNAVFSNQQE